MTKDSLLQSLARNYRELLALSGVKRKPSVKTIITQCNPLTEEQLSILLDDVSSAIVRYYRCRANLGRGDAIGRFMAMSSFEASRANVQRYFDNRVRQMLGSENRT